MSKEEFSTCRSNIRLTCHDVFCSRLVQIKVRFAAACSVAFELLATAQIPSPPLHLLSSAKAPHSRQCKLGYSDETQTHIVPLALSSHPTHLISKSESLFRSLVPKRGEGKG